MFPYFLLAKASLDVHDATAVFLVISILNGTEVRSGRCVFPGCTVHKKAQKKKDADRLCRFHHRWTDRIRWSIIVQKHNTIWLTWRLPALKVTLISFFVWKNPGNVGKSFKNYKFWEQQKRQPSFVPINMIGNMFMS